MKQMLHLVRKGGFSIPYMDYIEATVRIPPIKNYDEYVPIFVLKPSTYFSSRVPIQFGTTVLDRAMAKIDIEGFTHASVIGQQTYMSTVVMATLN